jgi:hypothetical protein
MSVIHLILVLAVAGLLFWLVNRNVPMDARIKSLLNVVVTIALVLWLLGVFGFLPALSGIQIGS